ncbi:MAG: UDP-3-O-acyl-N-acetylglucosamine deacetylase [Leptonema sp. (in: bacteria)]
MFNTLKNSSQISAKNSFNSVTLGRNYRSTIKEPITFKGVGLHTGALSKVRLLPAEADSGILFRSNKKRNGKIVVSPWNVKNTMNAVTLTNGIWEVHTIEHLLCAFAVSGITDIIVELSSNEIPIMDGSAIEFHNILESVGVFEFTNYKNTPVKLMNPVWVVSEDKYIIAVPSEEFKVTYTIHYEHPDLKGKSLHINLNSQITKKEILSARTFGFLKDVEYLRSKGLIKGASLENALVLTEDGYLNETRYPDECIRHKILDLIGDLYLLNRPIIAHIVAHRTGHSMDVALAKNILKNLENDELAKIRYN